VPLGGPDGRQRRGGGVDLAGRLVGTARAQRRGRLLEVVVHGDRGLDGSRPLRVEDLGHGPQGTAGLRVGGACRDARGRQRDEGRRDREPPPVGAGGPVPAGAQRGDGGRGVSGIAGRGNVDRGVGDNAGGGRGIGSRCGGESLGPDLGNPRGEHRDELVLGASGRGRYVPRGDEARGELLDELVVGTQGGDVEGMLGVLGQ
jgi:hypothetical protein